MKFITSIIFALGLALSGGPKEAQAKASVGAIAAYPEVIGVYGSAFMLDQLSVDGWLTTSTADLGLTAHFPVAEGLQTQHSILLTGMVGYAHNLMAVFPYRSYHAVFAAGYGFQSLNGWDIRAQLGTEVFGAHPVATGFHGHLMVGHMF